MMINAHRLSLLLFGFVCLLCSPTIVVGQMPCGTDAWHQKRMQIDERYAREYISLEDHLLEETINPSSRYLDGTVYTIPVVVHIMHKGESVGTGSNISDAQVQQGINHLNDAFSNLNAFSGNPAFTDAGISSVDAEISFCLASRTPDGSPTNGINRVSTTLSDLYRDEPTQAGKTQDDDLKALSFWDSNEYLNIWIVNGICMNLPDIGCGVAGYASLAGSHGQAYDGVVLEHAFWGLSANNSKIAVHEVGHYFNLLHTFQSGCPNNDCLIDGDKVCDTPPDQHSDPVSCSDSETINSCATDMDDVSINNPFTSDVQDMYENYMDYGFQSCQNTFTPGQKRRMRLALTQQRSSLLSSQGCIAPNGNPTVAFIEGFGEAYEMSTSSIDCREYTDYQIGIHTVVPSTQVNLVNVTLDAQSQSSLLADAELIGIPVNIPANSTSPHYFTLRLYDDDNVEGNEILKLNLSVLNGDATVASTLGSYNFNVYDNDLKPGDAAFLFFQENFEGNAHFAIHTDVANQSNSNWFVGTHGGMSGVRSLYFTASNTTPLVYDHQLPAKRSAVFTIDGRGFYNTNLQFDYKVNGEPNRDFGTLLYSLDSTNFYPVPGAPSAFVASPLTRTLDLDLDPQIFNDQKFYLAFQWQNDFNGLGSDPAWVIDNILLRGKQTQVETTLNALGEVYLGPNEDVYIYSNSSKKLIARIENLNAHDYGCTTVEIDRAGTGASEFWDPNPERYLARKTLKITPTHNTQLGHYRITMYYTQQEIASWASATNQSLNDFEMVKADININDITPQNYPSYDIITASTTISNFVNEVAVTAEFQNTGFSGFGAGVPGGNVSFPVEWVAFNGKYIGGSGTLLEWATATEKNSHYFSVERSKDGQVYERLIDIPAAGNSAEILDYQYTDPAPFEGINYYRLKQLDIDGSYTYSDVVEVYTDFSQNHIRLFPNPFQSTLQLYSETTGNQHFFLTNLKGQMIFEHRWHQEQPQTLEFSVAELPIGFYFWGLRNEHEVKGGKLMKVE